MNRREAAWLGDPRTSCADRFGQLVAEGLFEFGLEDGPVYQELGGS